MSEKEIVDFGDLQEPLLSELLNETFVVSGFAVGEAGRLGIRLVVKTDRGEFVTFSAVILEQLNMVEGKQSFPVRVTLKEASGTSGNYYKFVSAKK